MIARVLVYAILLLFNPICAGLAAPETEPDQSAPESSRPAAVPKIGLALGGGGTRGAAHVEVLRVLEQAGVPIDCIAGTSMGAIVGGLYAAGVPTEVIEKKFYDRSLMKAFMTIPLSVRIVAAPILIMPRAVGARPYDGLYKGSKFRSYIEHSVLPEDRNIEDLKLPFAAVALNLVDGKLYSIRKGNLSAALQASSAVPGLRKPVQIGEKLFVDGGVFSNVPVPQARQLGADIVIAVCVDERVKPLPLDTFRHVGSVSKRVLTLQLAFEDEPLVAAADIVIHPDVDGIGLISTKREDAERALSAGRAAALAALPEIKKRLLEAGVQLRPVEPTKRSAAAGTERVDGGRDN